MVCMTARWMAVHNSLAWHNSTAWHNLDWQANNNNNILIIKIQSYFSWWHLSFQEWRHQNSPATSSPSHHRSGGIVIVANISGWLLCNGGMGVVIVIVIITPSPLQWRSGGKDATAVLCRVVMQLWSVTTISSLPMLQIGCCVMGGWAHHTLTFARHMSLLS